MDVRLLTRPITADLMREASAERSWVEKKTRLLEEELAKKAGRDSKEFPEFNRVDIGIYDLVDSDVRRKWADEAVARGQKSVTEYTPEQVREMFWNDSVESLAKVFTERGFSVELRPYYSYGGGICCDLVVSW